MSRADRLLQIIQILRRARRPYPAYAIAEELEVSLRTIYRDIATLIASRVPIQGEAGIGYILKEGYDLPPLMFNASELEAVMLGMRMVAARCDEELARSARDVVAKIEAILPQTLKLTFIETPLYAVDYEFAVNDKIDTAQLRMAMRKEKKLSIEYINEKKEKTQRVIWPVCIGYFKIARIMVAWCELRHDFRHFRTDRIESVKLLDLSYQPKRKILFSQWRKIYKN